MSPIAQPQRPTILFTTERCPVRDVYFPREVLEELEALGEVRYHEGDRPLTEEQLRDLLPGVDVCLTHWRCPRFTPRVLEGADRLRLIAHAGGSVADLVSPEVFKRGITVTSVNAVMSRHVAEGVLTYLLADLHLIIERSELVRRGGWLTEDLKPTPSLSTVVLGLVGLGQVGRNLLDLLRPFGTRVLVFDPYVPAEELRDLGVEPMGLDELLSASDVVSVHASLTPETRGLLDARRLSLLRDGALLVNTARGGVLDGEALLAELRSERIRAVLDVFEPEPLPPDDPLRSLKAATLYPHVAGASAGVELAQLAVAEVARFTRGEPVAHPISEARARLMTAGV